MVLKVLVDALDVLLVLWADPDLLHLTHDVVMALRSVRLCSAHFCSYSFVFSFLLAVVAIFNYN